MVSPFVFEYYIAHEDAEIPRALLWPTVFLAIPLIFWSFTTAAYPYFDLPVTYYPLGGGRNAKEFSQPLWGDKGFWSLPKPLGLGMEIPRYRALGAPMYRCPEMCVHESAIKIAVRIIAPDKYM